MLLLKGDAAAALTEIEHEPDSAYRECVRAMILEALGKKNEARSELAMVERKHPDQSTCIAEAYAARGQADAAFDWLDRAVTAREFRVTLLRRDPFFSSLREDPRYTVLLKKMNLPDG